MLRPEALNQMLLARQSGEAVDPQAFARETERAVQTVVQLQAACGMDFISDGEMSKPSFMTYHYARLSGFTGPEVNFIPPDILDYQAYRDSLYDSAGPHPHIRQNDGPVTLLDPQAVQVDIANLQRALRTVGRDVEGFMCAASPGSAAGGGTSYYKGEQEFLHALVEAMKPEYDAIVQAGLVLQLDIPDILLAGSYLLHDRGLFRQVIQPRLEALREAMRGVPPDRLMCHICWGNWPGPHHKDTPLEWVFDLLLDLPCQGISIEATTRPHEHDWHLFEDPRIAGRFRSGEKLLFVGFVDTKATALETPEGIAERIALYANLVGKENLIASTDCGFGTFMGRTVIPPELVEEKLKRLAAGAHLASQRLWPATASV